MKKIISLLLSLVLLVSCVPVAFAAETPSVTVYLTVSKKNDFQVMNGKTMALYEITVPYFDLALYGLEEYYYNPDCYAGGSKETQTGGTVETAYGKVTMLHLFIYATEVIYNGLSPSKAGKGWLADQGNWKGFRVGGEVAGSSFCVFWEFKNDATYFLNYEYPLGRENWGASCDQILLHTGDIVSARYNAHTGNDGSYYLFGDPEDSWLTAEQGDEVPLLLFTTTSEDMDNGGETYRIPVTKPANVYVTKDAAPTNHAALTPIGQTDSEGMYILDTATLSPGLYYITTNTWDPAVAILEVFPGEEPPLYGDVNGDSRINAADAAITYAIANGKRTATADQTVAADVSGDGKINAADAALIYAYANGKRTSFPVEK
jgi:hypothetical protein